MFTCESPCARGDCHQLPRTSSFCGLFSLYSSGRELQRSMCIATASGSSCFRAAHVCDDSKVLRNFRIEKASTHTLDRSQPRKRNALKSWYGLEDVMINCCHLRLTSPRRTCKASDVSCRDVQRTCSTYTRSNVQCRFFLWAVLELIRRRAAPRRGGGQSSIQLYCFKF